MAKENGGAKETDHENDSAFCDDNISMSILKKHLCTSHHAGIIRSIPQFSRMINVEGTSHVYLATTAM